MKNIIFTHGPSSGDTLAQIGMAMQKSFLELDVALYPIDLTKNDFAIKIKELVDSRRIEFAFGFAGIGAQVNTDMGLNYWECVNVPFISLYGDSPGYFFDLHKNNSDWCVSLYGFSEHLEFRKRFPDIRGSLGAAPVFPLPIVQNNIPIDFKLKENGKIVFLKNGNDPLQLKAFWLRSFEAPISNALIEIAEHFLTDLDHCTHQDIVQSVLNFFAGIGFDPHGGSNLLLLMVAQLDDYFRRVKSQLVAEVLLDYPVEIHGINWQHLNISGRKGKLIEEVDYLKSNRLIAESLAIVDMSPNTINGIHDRQGRAAGAETLCITNAQPALDEYFGDSKLFTYQFSEESIRTRVEWLLSNRKEAVELGVDLAAKFNTRFSMEKAFSSLERMSALTRLNMAETSPINAPGYFVWPPKAPAKQYEQKQEGNQVLAEETRRDRGPLRRYLSKLVG